MYPLHLCQPDQKKSCGACCCLYNWEDHSRHTLEALLRRRINLFLSLRENPDLQEYSRLSRQFSDQGKLCETIYNCEFLGFLDREEKRVGCLLHPSLHQGRDLRVHSFYGVELRAGHFCPSYTYLTAVEQEAVITAIDDWYLYGLVITDIDFVKEFFTIIQNRLRENLKGQRVEGSRVQEALLDFFRLKENWIFQSSKNRLGKYCFSQAEYQIAQIEYERNWNMKPSRFNKILVSLSSEFKTREDVVEAELIIEEKIRKFIEAYNR